LIGDFFKSASVIVVEPRVPAAASAQPQAQPPVGVAPPNDARVAQREIDRLQQSLKRLEQSVEQQRQATFPLLRAALKFIETTVLVDAKRH